MKAKQLISSVFHLISLPILLGVISLPGSAQSVEFEELPSLPLVDIQQVYITPKHQDLYVNSIFSDVFKSSDNGDNWEKVNERDDDFYIRDIDFLSDDTPLYLISSNLVPVTRHLAFIENDSFVRFLPTAFDSLEEVHYCIRDTAIYLYNDRKLYITRDKGESFEIINDTEESLQVKEIFVTDDRIIVIEVDTFVDINIFERGSLRIYDRDFNFIEKNDLGIEWLYNRFFPQAVFEVNDSEVIIFDTWSDRILYSADLGKTFLEKEIVNQYYNSILDIREGNLIFNQLSLDDDRHYTLSIKLDSNFVSNPIDTIFDDPYCIIGSLENQSIILVDRCRNQFEIRNLSTGQSVDYASIPFPALRTQILHVSDQGLLQVSGINYNFQYDPNTQTWDKSYMNAVYKSYLNNGARLFNDTEVLGKISVDGQTELWELSLDTSSTFIPGLMVSNDDERIRVVLNSDASEEVGMYVSENFGPFEPRSSKIRWLATSHIQYAVVGDEIVFAPRMSQFVKRVFKIDLKTDSISEHVDPVLNSIGATFSYVVSKEGTIFANISGGITFPDTTFFLSYYKNDWESKFKPAGRAPKGELFRNEIDEYNIIINDSHKLFVQENLFDNYKEVEILNRNFDSIETAGFDTEGNLYLVVDFGRVVKIKDLIVRTSIGETEKNLALDVYPNPSTQFIQVRSSSNLESLQIYDIEGRLVKHKQNLNDQLVNLDLADLRVGIYILTAMDKNGQYHSQKLIKF